MAQARARPAANVLQELANEMMKQGPVLAPWRLNLVKQNCIGEEKYSKAGRSCMAKVVVKKSPFLIQFALEPADADVSEPPPDLHSFQFEARLVYEYDETKVRVQRV